MVVDETQTKNRMITQKNHPDAHHLFVAARDGDMPDIKYWLDKGVPIDVKDSVGYTPLMFAIIGGQKDIVEFLLQNGADPNILEDTNGTPLHLSCIYRSASICASALLKGGANVNAQNSQGQTPFFIAVSYAVEEKIPTQEGLLQSLIDAGADIWLPDNSGYVPADIIWENKDTLSFLHNLPLFPTSALTYIKTKLDHEAISGHMPEGSVQKKSKF